MFQQLYLMITLILNMHNEQRCVLNARYDFGWPAPIVLRQNKLLEPTDRDGIVTLLKGDQLVLSCEGSPGDIYHPNALNTQVTATITCEGGDYFKNEGWLSPLARFQSFTCSDSPIYRARRTNRTCHNSNRIVEVGYAVGEGFYPSYESCFDESTYTVLYSNYSQRPYNAMFQTGGQRPFFKADNIYGNVPVEGLFYKGSLKSAVFQAVGSRVSRYVTNNQFLSRGHLAARTDFVFDFGQRATFHYVNCAPQWYGFNSGNWNTLEIDLRQHIHDANLNAVIYTGTYGVTSLENEDDRRIDLYLHSDRNNNPVVPVPEYYYKVAYEPSTHRGVAFVGINNPYYSREEARQMFFCQDICRGNRNFSWLSWHPDNPSEGYAFCCDYNDFKNTVNHLPANVDVHQLLT